MPCDYPTAIDEICTRIKTDWDSGTTAIIGYIPQVYWNWLDKGVIPDPTKFWARVVIQTVATEQSALAARRFTSYGVVSISIFGPKAHPVGNIQTRALASYILQSFRKCPNIVKFRDATITEKASENGCIRCDVVSRFEYDEVV